MGIGELFLLAVGLSMDAIAVSVSNCLAYGRSNGRRLYTMPLYFGGFQALMPILGACVGGLFADIIQKYSGWAVFLILGAIGASMVWEAIHGEEEEQGCKPLTHWMLLCQAVATSIDALAVGVTFAFLKVLILPAVTFIGVTTFLLSAIGVRVGAVFGARFRSGAELAGGVILVLMGLKILLEHLGFLG